MSDFSALRRQFPIIIGNGKNVSHLQKKDDASLSLHSENFIYLDTAASSQKPKKVLEAVQKFYSSSYSNIHRGAHFLGDKATEKYENARKKMAHFLGAKSAREIIFTKNATESINLVAHSIGEMENFFKEGDRILLTKMEHHANMIPWFQLAKRKKLHIEYIDFDEEKNLILQNLDFLLEKPTKLVALCHVSNVLGTKNEVKKICQKAKEKGVLTLVDACQSVPHMPINVEEIGCDFLGVSSHKMYGPTGVGVLYGKLELLKKMPPFLGGGDMIREVNYEGFTVNEIPAKFEAGTPPIAEVVGLGAAIDFLEKIGMENIFQHDTQLSTYAHALLSKIPKIKILSHKNACGLVSFSVKNMQHYDISDELSDAGICVRVGHHCAEPLHQKLGVKTSLRASFGIYTTKKEVEIFAQTLEKIINN